MSDKGKKTKNLSVILHGKAQSHYSLDTPSQKTQWDDDKGRLTKGYKTEMKPYFHLVHK